MRERDTQWTAVIAAAAAGPRKREMSVLLHGKQNAFVLFCSVHEARFEFCHEFLSTKENLRTGAFFTPVLCTRQHAAEQLSIS